MATSARTPSPHAGARANVAHEPLTTDKTSGCSRRALNRQDSRRCSPDGVESSRIFFRLMTFFRHCCRLGRMPALQQHQKLLPRSDAPDALRVVNRSGAVAQTAGRDSVARKAPPTSSRAGNAKDPCNYDCGINTVEQLSSEGTLHAFDDVPARQTMRSTRSSRPRNQRNWVRSDGGIMIFDERRSNSRNNSARQKLFTHHRRKPNTIMTKLHNFVCIKVARRANVQRNTPLRGIA